LAQINKILEEINSLKADEKQILLSELFKLFKEHNSLEFIQTVVCNYFRIPFQEIKSRTRIYKVALARHLIMYFARKQTTFSLSGIGKFCGDRDHATVLHAYKRIEKLIQEKEEVGAHVQILSDFLTSGHLPGLIKNQFVISTELHPLRGSETP